jgi:hypothetical protein
MRALLCSLLLTTIASAEEWYVPLAGRTEVDLANPSPGRAKVEVGRLGGKVARVELDGGATGRWVEESGELGVLRIEGQVRVTAVSDSGARVSVPVLSAAHAVTEAVVPVKGGGGWRSGVVIVNVGQGTVFVDVDGVMYGVERVLKVDGGSRVKAQSPVLVFAHNRNDITGAELFGQAPGNSRKRRAVRSVTPAPQQPQTIVLTPSKDNTLFESNDGSASNGVGVHLFAGTTNSRLKRRALVAFDVAGQVPPGSRITRVSLTMRVTQTISGAEPMPLHRVSADWGEGTSNAGPSRDGGGAPARTNDATWLHRFFSAQRWTTPGGDFNAAADATAQVASGPATWESAAMTATVQQWLDQPASNFGWILLGNESRAATAKKFDSREISTQISRPSLTIEWTR